MDISLLNPKNKKNSFNFPSIHTLRKILNLCEEKEIHLKIFRIPSKLNVIADALSRKDPLPSEGTLDPKGRGPLFTWAGVPQIDLMATPFNGQVRRFIPPFTHEVATGVDVRMMDWKMWNKVYILPLPAMIGWVLLQFAKFKWEVLFITCLPPSSILWKIVGENVQPTTCPTLRDSE